VIATRERLLALPATALQRKLIAADTEPALIALVDQALTELAARGVGTRGVPPRTRTARGTHADRA
jgi:hypothetical protein